jgi:hypothetical protein
MIGRMMIIMNDTTLKVNAMELLIEKFGPVDTERFISLMNKESFDYTVWHRELFKDMSVKEISRAAKKYCDKNK